MDFVNELKWRGLLNDATDLEKIKALRSARFYCGFDPTAPSLQVGNLVPLISMVHIARGGLEPIVLFGGATGAIGDPSGKSDERSLLSREEIDRNVQQQKKQFKEIYNRLDIEPIIVNNYDWTKDVHIIDFLRDIGKHFTVNYMLQKESVKSRITEGGISFTEFSYMLLQAYDFLHLYEHYNCKLQVGGSDQWGNITAGCELIRRKLGKEAYALTFPLITDSHGKKLGKSEGGAIWLDPQLTSPFRFHQYWLNTDDRDVIRFLKILTFYSKDEIAAATESLQKEPEKRRAQKMLADALCTLVHGENATALANRCAKVLFGGSMEGLGDEELIEIFADVPSTSMPKEKLWKLSITELLVESGLCKSKGEARRLISSGGAYLNNERIEDGEKKIGDLGLAAKRVLVLRAGKKTYHLVKADGV